MDDDDDAAADDGDDDDEEDDDDNISWTCWNGLLKTKLKYHLPNWLIIEHVAADNETWKSLWSTFHPWFQL